ncbi:MAG: PAS domain S-box protein, partial [candidate division Zixibacteria bacterium]|nr:PAS domain S-box protein [candidate division Zixibacteria bacterium]
NNKKERRLLLDRLKKERCVRDFEVELKRKDGTLYYASLTISPFTLGGKKVLLTVSEDISERKQEDEEKRKYYDGFEKKVKEQICKFRSATEKLQHHIAKRLRAEEKLKQHEQALEASEKELKNFSRKILSIREEEKKNLSAILHDEVGSMAVAFSSYLTAIEEEIKNKNLKNVLKATAKSKSMLKQFVSRLKKIAADLRPPDLEIIGLPGALREYFSDVTEKTNLKIDFRVYMSKKRIKDDVAIILYRIVNEAFNNIINHANASEAKVTLYCRGNKLKLIVGDNGKGFDTEKSFRRPKIHLGLLGMREMVESLDGTFNIKSAPEKGTEISVTLLTIRKDKS